MTSKKRISVIVACYNEADNIEPMYERLSAVLRSLERYDYEIIFVDNDSIDDSAGILLRLAGHDPRVKVLMMSRNFGSPQPSFLAGLAHCRGHAAILLQGDIQDPPELIPAFVEKWEAGYEVVYGISRRRHGFGALANLVFRTFYALLARMSYITIPLNAGEFSLIGRRALDELLKIDEYDYYIRCLRAYVGFKQIGIEYERSARSRGRSSQNLLTLLWWAKTLIINFSFKPLEWIALLAMAVVIVAFVSIVAFLISYAINPDSPRGIPTLFVLILFMGGIQLLALSVVAEYLAKIFLEVKRRPRYIVRHAVNFDAPAWPDRVDPAHEP